MKVGILAVQGDYEAHGDVLSRLGVVHAYVKTQADLEGVEALILPGGESTTQLKFLVEEGLDTAIRDFAARGGPIFGTCAGTILLAREVHNPAQASLGLADLVVQRNAYGRQIASEVRTEASRLKDAPLEMVFIRAPVIEKVGEGVEVLASSKGQPVLVRQGKVLASTFHPELTADTTVHEYFLKMASAAPAARHNRTKVVFVCLGNSCRSQMAESIARHLASDVIEASSGGISPLGFIAKPTLDVLRERGVEVNGQFSKGLRRQDLEGADLIVNMTGRPGEALFPDGRAKVEDWNVRDPYGDDLEMYREICNEIQARVTHLAERLRQEHAAVGTS